MPAGAADQRGEESAAMEGVMHARRSDPRIGDWLIQCEDADLDAVARAQLRHIRHRYDRTCKVPARLAAELARVTSLAQGVWAAAREADLDGVVNSVKSGNKLPFDNQIVDTMKEFEKSVKTEINSADAEVRKEDNAEPAKKFDTSEFTPPGKPLSECKQAETSSTNAPEAKVETPAPVAKAEAPAAKEKSA